MRRTLAAALVLLAILVPAAGARTPAPPRLVFASERTGVSQLYSVGPAGRGLAQLTFGSAGAASPVPSPDGRWVAFTRPSGGIWVVRADGRGLRRLAAAGDQPAWAPDSLRIAYRDRGIALVGVDGTGAHQLITSQEESRPAWSPDGRSLLFLHGDSLVVLRGRSELTIATGVSSAAWSPDGRLIAYEKSAELDVVRPNGSGQRRVAPLTSATFGSVPAWAPNGRRIAFVDLRDVRVATVATGSVRTLARGAWGTSLAWSPAGDAIAFSAFQDSRIEAVTPAGRVRTVLTTPYGDVLSGVAWTRPPAGLRLRKPQPVPPVAMLTPREFRTREPIAELAADGDRVAFVACARAGYPAVATWHPGDASVVPIGPHGSLSCKGYSSPEAFYSLALAGDRVAYAVREGGIQVRWTLLSASTRQPKTLTTFGSGATCCAGDPLLPPAGDFLGSGDLLVYSTWEKGATGGIVSQTLWRLQAATPTQVATAAGPLDLLDVDSGRIVVRTGDGSIALLDAAGTRLRTFPFPPGGALGAELAGSDLSVLLHGALNDYDAGTGALRHSWPLPDVPSAGFCGRLSCPTVALRLEGAARGLVTYVLDGQVHLLRLSDGVDSVVAAGSAAQLDDSGLFYAYAGADPWPGRLRFVPFAELPLR